MENDKRILFLVEQLQNDDMTYFHEFYELTKKMCFYMCYSIVNNHADSEDAMQNTYIRFLANVKKINLNKPILGYLIKMAKNTSINLLKKKKHESLVPENIEHSSKSDMGAYNELLEKMKELLKPIEFEVVYLHVVEDLKHVEIASLLHKPLGTITYTYKIAMDKLRRDLK